MKWYVQDDGTLWVPAEALQNDDVQSQLMAFAELCQRHDHLHMYRIRPVTLWHAASQGWSARDILTVLRANAAHALPLTVQRLIVDETSKWGRLQLLPAGCQEIALTGDLPALEAAARTLRGGARRQKARREIVFPAHRRAEVKRELARHGWPVIDHVGYSEAPALELDWQPQAKLRGYQLEAVERFCQTSHGGSAVVVLPCGAGKTWVGLGVMIRVRQRTLILTPNEASAEQWRDTLLTHTTLKPSDVSLYQPDQPLTPVTITTYQRVAARTRAGERRNLVRLTQEPWGLVIYDEVHMLPAPLFRLAAELQSVRRLGLTATLVREDGAETDVFSLIGSKCYELPWRRLEAEGYLARARCVEVRVPLSPASAAAYERASPRERHRIAAVNPLKVQVVRALARRHSEQAILVLGHYLDGLRAAAQALGCPLLTGNTPGRERNDWFGRFRAGQVTCLVLSRIANLAVDLPNAAIGIQVSGLFGSRQEEAQRLGRLLRPKTGDAVFYTLVSAGTVEQEQARRRQLYLVEQGYQYDIWDAERLFIEEECT